MTPSGSDDLGRLNAAARTFTTDPSRYLAEAMQCLRRQADPVAALELLVRLWGPPHAKSTPQKHALNDAGDWLEKRLQDPTVDADRLLRELGWLRRMVTINSPGPGRSDGKHRDRGEDRAPAPDRSFGKHLDDLRKKRASVPRPKTPPIDEATRRRERVEFLLRDLKPENASTRFPELFADQDPVERQALAERCVAALQRKRVRDAQKAEKQWVRPLTEILGKLG